MNTAHDDPTWHSHQPPSTTGEAQQLPPPSSSSTTGVATLPSHGGPSTTMAYSLVDTMTFPTSTHDESYFETLHASAGPDVWSPAMFQPAASGDVANVASQMGVLSHAWLNTPPVSSMNSQYTWSIQHMRPTPNRTPYSDPGVSPGLQIFTGSEPVHTDEVPALSGVTEGSITTTSFSPTDFRSPLQPNAAHNTFYMPSPPPNHSRGCSVPPSAASLSRTDDELPQLSRQVGRNFPASATAPLRDWFQLNLRDPYPTKETKQQLADASGLTVLQVNNWFINQRKRFLPKETSYTTTSELFPGLVTANEALNEAFTPFSTDLEPYAANMLTMPGQHQQHEWPVANMSSMHHFQATPNATPRSQSFPHLLNSSAGSSINLSPTEHRITAPESSKASPGPQSLRRTQTANTLSSTGTQESSGVGPRRGRRRQHLPPRVDPVRSSSRPLAAAGSSKLNAKADLKHSSADEASSDSASERDVTSDKKAGEIFQCTFPGCGKSFSSKTWKRHEETKHLPRFQWTCMASGFLSDQMGAGGSGSANISQHDHHDHASSHAQQHPHLHTPHLQPDYSNFLAQTTIPGRLPTCIFCKLEVSNPAAHPTECLFRLHDCLSRPPAERTFTRKDHLFQHLRNFHRFTPPDGTFGQAWKSRVEYAGKSWGCGFCGERLGSWERRARHLRSHFREGWRVETGWDEAKARGSGWSSGVMAGR